MSIVNTYHDVKDFTRYLPEGVDSELDALEAIEHLETWCNVDADLFTRICDGLGYGGTCEFVECNRLAYNEDDYVYTIVDEDGDEQGGVYALIAGFDTGFLNGEYALVQMV